MARITYKHEGEGEESVDVNLAQAPFDEHGKPASLLAIAMANNILIEHSCGGVCACSTCHVVVEKGIEQLNEAEDGEEDMLDTAPGLTMNSRLACQAEILSDDAEIVVRIPAVNRNFVSETSD